MEFADVTISLFTERVCTQMCPKGGLGCGRWDSVENRESGVVYLQGDGCLQSLLALVDEGDKSTGALGFLDKKWIGNEVYKGGPVF